jgi:hypothetical protein
MLMRMGPFVPEDLNVVIMFHFGQAEGHSCDMARFDWYINGKLYAPLNLNNVADSNGKLDAEGTAWEGPFAMNMAKYLKSDLCSPFDFSFVCKSGDGSQCHEGAARSEIFASLNGPPSAVIRLQSFVVRPRACQTAFDPDSLPKSSSPMNLGVTAVIFDAAIVRGW